MIKLLLKLLSREKLGIVLTLSSVCTVLSLAFFLPFSSQFKQAYYQLGYFNSSNFNYVYTTEGKLPSNSYLDLKNNKSFFSDVNLTQRLRTNSIMKLDVNYDDNGFIKSKDVMPGLDLELSDNEVFITKFIARKNNLKVGDFVYSKSIYDQEVKPYKIVGMLENVNSASEYSNSTLQGMLVLGYDKSYEDSSLVSFVNYSKTEPSQILLDNKVILVKLYSKTDLLNYPLRQTLIYIILQISATIFLSMVFFLILVNSSRSNYQRMKRIGAIQILNLSLVVRSSLFLFISIVSLLLFNFTLSLIYRENIDLIIILITTLTIVSVIVSVSIIDREVN
jgi:hypothetical protein